MDAHPPAPGSDPVVTDEIVEARVRRAPKYAVFVVLGIGLGVLAAAILTFAFGDSGRPAPNGAVYSDGQVFGFLVLICGSVGALLGGALAVLLDRTVGRRTRVVRVDHESVRTGR